ncbi:hypothetical protein DSECCO2_582090 [anaerobic digester metagenome]
MSAARTLVRQPPMMAPSGSSLGIPALSIPMSVVVPPTSTTTASSSPVRFRAPIRLAAGPERMVSTGRSLASFSPMSEPSPLTIISGAAIWKSVSTFLTDWISSAFIGISLALSTAVSVRS